MRLHMLHVPMSLTIKNVASIGWLCRAKNQSAVITTLFIKRTANECDLGKGMPPHRRHFQANERNQAIGMLEAGDTQRHVAIPFGVSQSVISRLWK